MARKRFPALRAKKKPCPRVGKPAADTVLSCAHPRLVHGFLVRLAAKPGGAGTKAAPAPVATPPGRSAFPFDTRHEGPADDSTFH